MSISNKYSKIFFISLAIFLGFTGLSRAFSESFSFQDEFYTGNIMYTENVNPGDAVTARLSIKYLKNAKKKNLGETKATLVLMNTTDGKKVENSQFFALFPKGKKNQNHEMLALLPLSTWLDAKKNYSLTVVMSVLGQEEKEFSLPFKLTERSFINETIELDNANTAIKTNMTQERLNQIERLNKILKTVDKSAVRSLKPFVKPVNSDRMTSFFGDRRVFKYSNGKSETTLHYGNDYGVPEGTDVLSCQDGKVVMAEFRISTGWSVCIEHLPGLYSLYYHLSSLSVKEGDMVKEGQKIGKSGQTGLATGPHLHWEVRLNMCAVKPEFFMQNYTFETE